MVVVGPYEVPLLETSTHPVAVIVAPLPPFQVPELVPGYPAVIAPAGVGAQTLEGNPAVVIVAGEVGKLFVFAVRVVGEASVAVYSTYTRSPTKREVITKVRPLA